MQTNTTLTRLNAGGAEELPAFLEKIGVRRFSMNLFIPAGSGRENGGLLLPYREVGQLIERVRRRARERGLEFSWYSPVPHCLYNPLARGLGNKSCAAVDGLLSVSPSGQVLPCSSWAEPIGDLLRQPFEEIWGSERARWFKQKRYAPPECTGCTRFTACQAACPLYWRQVGTGEIAAARAAGASRGTAAAGTRSAAVPSSEPPAPRSGSGRHPVSMRYVVTGLSLRLRLTLFALLEAAGVALQLLPPGRIFLGTLVMVAGLSFLFARG